MIKITLLIHGSNKNHIFIGLIKIEANIKACRAKTHERRVVEA